MYRKVRSWWAGVDPLKAIVVVLTVALLVALVNDWMSDRGIERRADSLVASNRCETIQDQIETLTDTREVALEEDIAVLIVEGNRLDQEGLTPEERETSTQLITDAYTDLDNRQPIGEFRADLRRLEAVLEEECPTIEDVLKGRAARRLGALDARVEMILSTYDL